MFAAYAQLKRARNGGGLEPRLLDGYFIQTQRGPSRNQGDTKGKEDWRALAEKKPGVFRRTKTRSSLQGTLSYLPNVAQTIPYLTFPESDVSQSLGVYNLNRTGEHKSSC